MEGVNFNNFYCTKLACFSKKECLHVLELQARNTNPRILNYVELVLLETYTFNVGV